MKKIVAICFLVLLITVIIAPSAFAASEITLKIISQVKPDHTSTPLVVSCTHYYSVTQNGVEVVPYTHLPDNEDTKVQLPKISDKYVVHFYFEEVRTNGEVISREVDVYSEFSGKKNYKIYFISSLFGHGTLTYKVHIGDSDIDTDASEEAGAVSVAVAAIVVLGGLAASAAGAGAASVAAAGETERNEENSSFSMVIYKDFGNKIKYNADTVYVHAKMIEITPVGKEIERPDLTENISISSENEGMLEISENVLIGEYMSAGVLAGNAVNENTYEKAIISFKFIGEGGVFQNNVAFNVVGKEYISLEADKLFVLGLSGRSFSMPFELVGFSKPIENIEIKPMNGSVPFTFSHEIDAQKGIISVVDNTTRNQIDKFFDSYPCEIIASNSKEYARAVFDVVMCFEGVLPDFLGGEPNIIAYKNDEDIIPPTKVALRVGLWDENKNTLNVQKPNSDVSVDLSDEANISTLLGIHHEFDYEMSTDSYLLCVFNVEKPFPSEKPAECQLILRYSVDGKDLESETLIKLMPDLLAYEKDWQKEYDNCVKIINTYLPPGFRSKKLIELNNSKHMMGVADLQLYRKNCWFFASRLIMQEREDYLLAEAWYDEAIATAELLDYIGGIALDLALGPFVGPISGFFISHVKSTLLELIEVRISNGTITFDDLYDILVKRLIDTLGQADNLLETPGTDKVLALSIWLATYVVYRIIYRWIFDKDENDNRKGLYAAIENGLLDFAGKGITILLSNFVKGIADKRGLTKGSTADSEQEYLNEKVRDAALKGFDIVDEYIPSIDKKIDELIAAIADLANRIVSKVV